jgi:patatin-like phospholipase/acyl hydrolase
MAKTFILACDGGGIRGYITSSVLQRLSTSAAGFLSQVSLNAGTSTGSFISLGLAAGVSIDTIQTQYQQANAAPLFTPNPNLKSSVANDRRAIVDALRARTAGLGGIWNDLLAYLEYFINASYTNTGVQQAAQTLLGASTTLSQLAPVVINTLQLDNTTASQWTPLSITNGAYGGMLAWEAAMCSGAAPIYFPPYSPESVALGYCADGGLFANNPSLAAIAYALRSGIAASDLYVLSLDTGTTSDAMPAAIINDWGGPLDMGPAQWLLPYAQPSGATTTPKFPLLSALMDASSEAITQQAQMILGANYFRVSVPLTAAVALDDTSDAAYGTMNDSLDAYYGSSAFTAAVCWLQSNGLS